MDVDDEDAPGDSDDELEELLSHPPEKSLSLETQPVAGSSVGEWFVERAKYIPVRLTLSERKYLRLLEAALNVSEYTDKIDTIGFGLSKAKRIVHQIRELCAIMSGLVLSADYKQGQELFQDRDFAANDEFYQMIFELGRRHKIMNPDKMRSTYGKLIYLLQVSVLMTLTFIVLQGRHRIAKHPKSRTYSVSLASAQSTRCTAYWRKTVFSICCEKMR